MLLLLSPLQILPLGTGAIVESHLAAIDGHQRHRSLATTMIMSTIVNASTALLSSDALALLDSLKEVIGDKDAAVIAVKSPPPPRGRQQLHSLSLI
jgi:hypothetical protein